jgi:phage FluMu protein Com
VKSKNMPLSRICLSCTSVASLPCSIESAPASIAVCILVESIACTATFRCTRCASSIAAASSGTVRFSSAVTLVRKGRADTGVTRNQHGGTIIIRANFQLHLLSLLKCPRCGQGAAAFMSQRPLSPTDSSAQ